MTFVVVLALVVFMLSVVVTGVLARGVFGLSILDHPNERSLHARPTPRTGGLGILAGFTAGLIAAALSGRLDRDTFWIAGMLVLIAVVSICDDRWDLPAAIRFAVHFTAAAGVVLGAGVAIRHVTIPFAGTFSLGMFAVPVSILFITWMTNLYNFMDGMDGLAGSMSVTGFGLVAMLAFATNAPLALVAMLVVPAVAGFLVHNRPPATIFMGDSGSTSLGFLAGALGVAGVARGTFELWSVLLAFSPFLVDATNTLLRRAAQGKRVWQAHREHWYQRLVLAGWTHRRTLAHAIVVMLLCAFAAAMFERGDDAMRAAVLIGGVVLYLLIAAGVRAVEARP